MPEVAIVLFWNRNIHALALMGLGLAGAIIARFVNAGRGFGHGAFHDSVADVVWIPFMIRITLTPLAAPLREWEQGISFRYDHPLPCLAIEPNAMGSQTATSEPAQEPSEAD